MYDMIVIGGGPAGMTAALYALRNGKTVLVLEKHGFRAPAPGGYGVWVPGVPVLVEGLLVKMGCSEWLRRLVVEGIVAGVGSVLGFVPQMFVLFAMLAFLEACGYMARIAFMMDRLFRRSIRRMNFCNHWLPKLVG